MANNYSLQCFEPNAPLLFLSLRKALNTAFQSLICQLQAVEKFASHILGTYPEVQSIPSIWAFALPVTTAAPSKLHIAINS